MAEKSRFRLLLGNAWMMVSGRTVTGIFSLIYIALAARGLGIEAFGVLTLINAYAQTIGDFAQFQSWQAVLHYGTSPLQEGRRADLHRVIRFSLVLDAGAAIAGMLVALLGAWFFAEGLGWFPAIVQLGTAYCTSILFMSSTTPTGVLRLMDRFDLIALQSTISSIVRLVGSVGVYLAGGGLTAYLAVWYLSTLIAFLYMAWSAVSVFRHSEHAAGFLLRDRLPLTHDMPGAWTFMWNINLNSTLGLVTTRVATLVVGGVFGPSEAALFRIARQVSDAATRPAKLLVPALYPELARLWSERDMPQLRRLCLQLALTAGGVATVALAIFALFGGQLITLVVGPEYIGATGIMLWLFAASVITVWSLPLEPLLISTGRSGTALKIRAAVTLIYFAILYPAMHVYGLIGVGVAAVAAALTLLAGQLTAVIRNSARA